MGFFEQSIPNFASTIFDLIFSVFSPLSHNPDSSKTEILLPSLFLNLFLIFCAVYILSRKQEINGKE